MCLQWKGRKRSAKYTQKEAIAVTAKIMGTNQTIDAEFFTHISTSRCHHYYYVR